MQESKVDLENPGWIVARRVVEDILRRQMFFIRSLRRRHWGLVLSGLCEQANATASAETINFSVGGAGAQTIAPGSALPTITDTVVVRYPSTPTIE